VAVHRVLVLLLGRLGVEGLVVDDRLTERVRLVLHRKRGRLQHHRRVEVRLHLRLELQLRVVDSGGLVVGHVHGALALVVVVILEVVQIAVIFMCVANSRFER